MFGGQFQGSQAAPMGLNRQCGLGIRKAVSPGRRARAQPVLQEGPGVGGRLGGEVAARPSVARASRCLLSSHYADLMGRLSPRGNACQAMRFVNKLERE